MVLAWAVRKGIFSLFAEQPQECAESVEVLPLKENSLLLVISPLKISLIVSWCSGFCSFVSKDTFLGDVTKSPKTQWGCVRSGKTIC